MPRNRQMIALAVVVVLALVIGTVALFPRERSADEESKSSGALAEGASGSEAAEGEGVGDSTTALVETPSGETYTVRKPKDTPTPPPAGPQAPADTWQQYLDATKAVVENNEAGLASAIGAVTAALQGADGAALEAMLAPDEAAAGYGQDLAGRYPTITGTTSLPTVNVFSSGEATLYFAYVLVQWQDAGISSEHTIPIMFRFVNGQWVITVLGETGSSLQFVQSVTL